MGRRPSDLKEKVLEAATRLLEETGFKGLSQPQVAKEVGIPQGHLTYYFPTRSDLVLAVAERALLKISDAIVTGLEKGKGTGQKKIVSLIGSVLKDRARTRSILGLLVESEDNHELREKLKSRALRTKRLVALSLGKPEDSAEVTLHLSTLWGLGLQYHLMNGDLSSAQLEECLTLLASRNQEKP